MQNWPIRVLLVLLLFVVKARAQAAAAPPAPSADDQSTLHVYVNLMQIPVLVLDQHKKSVPPIPAGQFRIDIEGLGSVPLAKVRQQGDDPLAIALVIDASSEADPMWRSLPRGLEPLLQSLQPHDRLDVYLTDGCTARRFGPLHMAPNLLLMQSVTTYALTYGANGKNRTGKCATAVPMEGLVAVAGGRLVDLPGRRLIIALGIGSSSDAGKIFARNATLLTDHSISLFPVVKTDDGIGSGSGYTMSTTTRGGRSYASGIQPSMSAPSGGPDPAGMRDWAAVAEHSGGMVLSTTARDLPRTLSQPIALARSRYILEFRRPDNLSSGSHVMMVSDGRPHDFIRAAGIAVPVATVAEAPDPSVEHGLLGSSLSESEAAAATTFVPVSPDAPTAPETAPPQ